MRCRCFKIMDPPLEKVEPNLQPYNFSKKHYKTLAQPFLKVILAQPFLKVVLAQPFLKVVLAQPFLKVILAQPFLKVDP